MYIYLYTFLIALQRLNGSIISQSIDSIANCCWLHAKVKVSLALPISLPLPLSLSVCKPFRSRLAV